jgi:hypothetical protein
MMLCGSRARSSLNGAAKLDGLKNIVAPSVPASAKLDSVGAARSIVMVVAAFCSVAGPRLPARSCAPVAANAGASVPVEQPVTVSVRVLPLSVPGLNVQPVAVPRLRKSPEPIPVTASEKVRLYVNVVAEETAADVVVNDESSGGTRSRMICASYVSGAASTLPAESVATVQT